MGRVSFGDSLRFGVEVGSGPADQRDRARPETAGRISAPRSRRTSTRMRLSPRLPARSSRLKAVEPLAAGGAARARPGGRSTGRPGCESSISIVGPYGAVVERRSPSCCGSRPSSSPGAATDRRRRRRGREEPVEVGRVEPIDDVGDPDRPAALDPGEQVDDPERPRTGRRIRRSSAGGGPPRAVPAGASRRRSWPGAVRAAVTSIGPPATGYPTGPLGIAEHTTASAEMGCRIGSGVRCPGAVRRGHPSADPGEVRPPRRAAGDRARPGDRRADDRLRRPARRRPGPDAGDPRLARRAGAGPSRRRRRGGGRDRPAPRRPLPRDRLPRTDRRGVPRPAQHAARPRGLAPRRAADQPRDRRDRGRRPDRRAAEGDRAAGPLHRRDAAAAC